MERTFIMVKPDGVQRGLVGEIIRRFEARGLKLVGLKMLRVDPERAERHYAVHQGKPFYDGLIRFITSGPSVAMVWEGRGAVAVARRMMGTTNPAESPSGTIRGDFALFTGQNIIHGSDGPETAGAEIGNFFGPDELVEYDLTLKDWIG